MTEEELREIYSGLEDLPLADERARLIRELGQVVLDSFDGKFESLLASAEGSSAKLVDILVKNITGFRDEATFKGRQCFFYKRAQILVADLHAAFDLTLFKDIKKLTMFPDYRVP